jgi:hypothetical protein
MALKVDLNYTACCPTWPTSCRQIPHSELFATPKSHDHDSNRFVQSAIIASIYMDYFKIDGMRHARARAAIVGTYELWRRSTQYEECVHEAR